MIDFPNSPTTGQTYTAANGVTYIWNGTLWLTTGSSGNGGDFYATGNGGAVPTGSAGVVLVPNVITGNSGSWYSTSTGRFTPPAGRYNIFAWYYGQAGGVNQSLYVFIYKNGAAVPATAQVGLNVPTNFPSGPTVQAIVDANGTDYFEFRAQATGASTFGNMGFGAFPISGIKGPQGDPPTAGGGIVREVTLASPAATIDLFSLGVRSCKMLFKLRPVNNSVDLVVRVATGTTANTTAGYSVLYTLHQHTTPTSAGLGFTGTSGGYTLASGAGNGGTQWAAGEMTVPDMTHQSADVFCQYYSGVGAWSRWQSTNLGPSAGSGCDGFQLICSAGNFAAGSFVRVIGWP